MRRMFVRENHYYGGDVLVEDPEDYEMMDDHDIKIRWRSYGDYSGGALAVSIVEAERLRRALGEIVEAACAADEFIRRDVEEELHSSGGHGEPWTGAWEQMPDA